MRWLLIGYMFLFIHRPFEVWPVLGEFRLELLYALFTGGIWLISPGKRWIPNPMHRALCAFVLALLTAGVFSPWTAQTFALMDMYLKLLFFYVVLVTVIHEEDGLKHVLKAFMIIMTVYILHSVWQFVNGRYHFRMSIVRLIGVDASHSDPNSFAATLIFVLALTPALWFVSTSVRWRGFLICYGILTVGCIALTGSRAGFVSLVLWAGLAILRSRRRFALCGLALAASPFMWAALPPSLQNRFETIIN
ncbi:MAG TPA: hypothetical protein VEL76_38075, partial [Gemmataceae bacterium]|nr:hypothetical protein [Gemmataceae bacterium]